MYFEIVSDALKGTSSDFGQLVVQRHFSSGIDCAMAGAATVADAASPAPAVFRNSRRFMAFPPVGFFDAEALNGCSARRRLAAILSAEIFQTRSGNVPTFPHFGAAQYHSPSTLS